MTDDSVIFTPVKVKFDGLDATKHFLDAEQLGRSIQGTAKLYNKAAYLFFNGVVPGNNSKYIFRMQSRAEIEKGSVCYTLWCAMTMGEMALYPQLWGELADFIIPDIVKSTYHKMTKRDDKVIETYDKMIERMQNENDKWRGALTDSQQAGFSAMLQSQQMFTDCIAQLSQGSKSAGINSVAPIGQSADFLEHKQKEQLFLIDQPMADAIRSKDELEVVDMQDYLCYIRGVDTISGTCKIELVRENVIVNGKISDPNLSQAGNIYTHALDEQGEIVITAKATLKDGIIHKLYISDARQKD